MLDETSSLEPGTIPLQEALRRIIRRAGDMGLRTDKRWCRVSFQELTCEENEVLDTGARMMFEWLQQGKLKALHRSDKQNLAEPIPCSVWADCELDEVHWHLSAIRAQPHTPKIENIKVRMTDIEYLVSQHEFKLKNQNYSIFSELKNKTYPPSQRAVQQHIEELKEKGTYIEGTTRIRDAIILIQNHANEKRAQGNKAVEVPGSDTIRRALDLKK